VNTPGERVLVQAGYACDLGTSLHLIPKFAWMMVATVRTVMLVLAADVVSQTLPVGLTRVAMMMVSCACHDE
jgi:hypothetical protein